MPEFSKISTERLNTCCDKLQLLFNEVIKYVDCSVLCGHRDKIAQDEAYGKGFSKLKYPNSKHNSYPSKAVDVIIFPIDWNDDNRNNMFIGFVRGIAVSMGVKIKCGADWDMRFNLKDNKFKDLPHFEIID